MKKIKNPKKRKKIRVKRIGAILLLKKTRQKISKKIENYLLNKQFSESNLRYQDCLWDEKELELILRDLYKIRLRNPNYEVFNHFKYEKISKNPKFKEKPLWFLKKTQNSLIKEYMDNISYNRDWQPKPNHGHTFSSYFAVEDRPAIEKKELQERKARTALIILSHTR